MRCLYHTHPWLLRAQWSVRKKRQKYYKRQRWWLQRKQCLPNTRGLMHIWNHRDCVWLHTQDQHRFKPDEVPALRQGSRHRLPSLTKKFSVIGACWEKEMGFLQWGITGYTSTHSRAGPMPRKSQPTQMNFMGCFRCWLLLLGWQGNFGELFSFFVLLVFCFLIFDFVFQDWFCCCCLILCFRHRERERTKLSV